MKKIIVICSALLMTAAHLFAADKINLKQLTSGEFAAARISGINPLPGTDQYVQISADGKQILQYSFKTGKQTSILFDIAHTQGIKIDSFDDYIMSPDGKRMLIRTETKPVYRRSNKAVYYIYTISSRKLNDCRKAVRSRLPCGRPTATWWPSCATTISSSSNYFMTTARAR